MQKVIGHPAFDGFRCKEPDKCELYKFIINMYDPRDDNAYCPSEKNIIMKRVVDGKIITIDQYLLSVYGAHKCTAKEYQKIPVDQVVVDRIISSYDLASNEAVYAICYYKWFRKFFSVMPRYQRDPNQIRDEERRNLEIYKNKIKDADLLNVLVESDYDSVVMGDIGKDYYSLIKEKKTWKEILYGYRNLLRLNSDDLPLWAQDYHTPFSFSKHFEHQLFEYVEVLAKIKQKEDYVYYFVGDGPGTGAIACEILRLNYVSMEPNGIGKIAREIGLISDFTPNDVKENKKAVLCLFNVVQYISLEQWLVTDRVLIVDPYLDEDLGMHHEVSSCGNVFQRGLFFFPLVGFNLVTHSRPFFIGKKIFPTDFRAALQADMEQLLVEQNGMPVTTRPEKMEMNILTRNHPGDHRVKNLNYKEIFGSVYPVRKGKNFLRTNDAVVTRHYNGYRDVRIGLDYKEDRGLIFIESIRPERVEGYIRNGEKNLSRLMLLQIVEKNDRRFGIYRDISQLGIAEVDDIVSRRKLFEVN